MHRTLRAIGDLARLATSLVYVLSALISAPALAVQPDELLKDPALEARAREISGGLRCLVCQNQSIDDSDAPLARDLRLLVRERLKAGDSNQQVEEFLVQRYGEFVLLRPRLESKTLLLWAIPLLALLGGVWAARRAFANAAPDDAIAPSKGLTADEEARLAALLNEPRESKKTD